MSANFLILAAVVAILGGALALGLAHWQATALVFVMAGWIVAVCLHEFGHARVAYAGGDESVRGRGYLTLDPLRYTHPLTSIIFPLAIMAMGGIGFPGAAVYIDRGALRGAWWRAGVSLAGPAMTGVAMIGFGLPFALGMLEGTAPLFVAAMALLCFLQATALLINLLPIPGLDGFGAIEAFLPDSALKAIAPFRNLGLILLLGVFLGAPELLAPLFQAAAGMVGALGVPLEAVSAGFQLFRF